MRYPLARFCSLLAVGASTIMDYRFVPFTPSEEATARPLLNALSPEDLLLADRYFAGSPTLARLVGLRGGEPRKSPIRPACGQRS